MKAPGRRWLSVALASIVSLGCGGGGGAAPGAERGHCYPNGTCNAGLTCLSTFCVHVTVDGGGDGGDGGARDGAAAGDATGAGGAGPADAFVPAPHPPLPHVANLGGPVLATPKVQPIFYTGDTDTPDLQAFLQELAATDYWRATTSEYGVGPLTVLPAITVATPPPAQITDAALRAQLVANTTGSAPWGAPDASVVYMMLLPQTTVATAGGGSCCTDFGGYHFETTSGTTTIPYAVICTCPGAFGAGVTPLQQRTATISHELVEAATDPFPNSNPAYVDADQAHLVWTILTGGELADMCALNADASFVPAGSTYMVQRSWSNAAAAAAQNPCVPTITGASYFNAFPVLDTVTYDPSGFAYTTQGVQIPLGQSKTIDLDLYSSGPTGGVWTVTAYSYESLVGGDPNALGLSLDHSTGLNGDKLRLTITPRSQNPALGAEAFVILSSSGGSGGRLLQANLSMGLVTN